ncbi:MAG: GspH/FimT family pseudopilin [Pseudomonadales bacterium]|nr:GspH/FimT family pseudopilin [Pseudomonadales bacterium]
MTYQRGLTLVEILVTLAIAAVLLGMAAPAFSGFVAQRSLTTNANDFVLAAMLARSEAVNRGTAVSLQAVNSGDSTNEWGPGWCVVVGNGGNCNNALRSFPAISNGTFDAGGNLNNVATLTFNSRGMLLGGLGGDPNVDRLLLCDDVPRGRQASVSAIGRVDIGDFLTCP